MPPGSEFIDPVGVPVKMYGQSLPERYRNYGFALGVAWTLWKERRNYDVAYFLMQGLHLVSGLPVAHWLGKPIVMKFSCSSLVELMTASWAGRTTLEFLRKMASRILILNKGMEEECRQANFDMTKVSWMPNPVNTDEFLPVGTEKRTELRAKHQIPDGAVVTLFVGRLDHQKKIPWLMGAFARVARQRPEAILAMVGDGPLREDIHQLTRDLGIEKNVVFTGRLPMSGVLEWMQLSDLTTLVSEVEGLPCSLIEAMAAGLPPVVSRIEAHTQLVDNEVHGLLTELGNEEDIATGLKRLIDDRELRLRLGQQARQRMIDHFSTSKVATYYETLFAEVLGNKPAL